MASAKETTDPKFLAFQNYPHMALNKFYSHRDNPSEVYELVEMKAATACFTHSPFFKAAITKEVQHEDLKNWRRWGKDVPALILQETVVALQPTQATHRNGRSQASSSIWLTPLLHAASSLGIQNALLLAKHKKLECFSLFFMFFLCQWL